MICLKSTQRSAVHATFEGSILKQYRGQHARQRLENEVRILTHLESRDCPLVPRLLCVDREKMEITITCCGQPVQHITAHKIQALFASLADYGVEHGDPEQRNITFHASDGNFYIVDFEFAKIVDNQWSQDLEELERQMESAVQDQPDATALPLQII